MTNLFKKLWHDDAGFIVSVELLFVAVILVIGIVAGLAALRAAVVQQFGHVGAAVTNLDPGYSIAPVGSRTGASNGTLVTHRPPGLNVGAARAALRKAVLAARNGDPS